jgi:D-3-phosphoglycerate dehydrogenase
MQFKVLITDYAWPDLNIEQEILNSIGAELIVAPDSGQTRLANLAANVDAIMTCWARVPEAVIAGSPHCRIVARFGIGLDNIDVDYCTRRQIVVTNVPDYCTTEVAEHTLALLMALSRRVAFYHHETKSGRYDLKAGLPIQRLAGKTLGIVGLGRIGTAVAARATALGMRTQVCSRQRRHLDFGRWCELDELLETSDFVSLHVPLSPETRHMIAGPQLKRMKSSAHLVNTARGALVDHRALADALVNNEIAGAALDVQEPEPPDLSSPPFNDPLVIVTPHAAFLSEQSLSELRRRTATQVATCLQGGNPENIVNPVVRR